MATQTQKRTADKPVALRKVHVVTPTSREESNGLDADFRRMGCLGLWEKSWRVRCEEMVRELVTGEVDQVYSSTIRDQPDRWNAELWTRVYGFKQGGEGMATKKEDCTRDKFSHKLDPKYGYFVKNCKDERKNWMLAFLVPILSPEKPYNITLTLATTLLLAYSEKKVVDWRSIIGELVHWLATNTNFPTLVLSPSTFTRTETCSWTKRKPNGQGIRSYGSSRPPTWSQRWARSTRRRKMRQNLVTKSGPCPRSGN
jgi:hypothetical protein